MRRLFTSPACRFGLSLLLFVALGSPRASAELDPKAITIQLPAQIKWVKNGGAETAVLLGDPAKPGLYVVLQKWLPNNNSRPHFHANDRYIYVISGTWWVGTGDVFDPDKATVPMPAGSFVTHHAKQVHWDGAKDGEAVLAIMGIGPAASNPSPTAKIPPKN